MFVFWYFTLYTILLLNGKYFDNGVTAIMVISACFWDILLYSLVSQWVKRPSVSKPVIKRNTDTDFDAILERKAIIETIKKEIEKDLINK